MEMEVLRFRHKTTGGITMVHLKRKKFGLLKVIDFAYMKNHRSYWLCRCECGNEKIVAARQLKSGQTKSCGCLHRKHGQFGTRLYHIWNRMKDRCYNENHKSYKDYGGRGVVVCDEWNDFKCFEEWAITNGYDDDLTIDRIDVNGNYEPSNCKWSTKKEQANNKRNNHFVTCNGERRTITEWAEITGVTTQTIYKRLRRGWSPERAVSEKPHK